MARKKVVDNPKPGLPRRSAAKPGKKKKKTTRKKTAKIKTAAQIAQTDPAPSTDDSAVAGQNDEGLPRRSEAKPGIVCPRCGCRDLRAPDGRPWEITHTERKFGFIRRRRVCRYCKKVVITREKTEDRA